MLPILNLKPKEQRRLKSGHLWIFRDELIEPTEPLASGSLVRIHTDSGVDMGIGFYHPTSQIAVRLLRFLGNDLTEDFFRERLQTALALRRRLFPVEQSYRLVFGESDFLPGLIIDRYHDGSHDYFAVQCLSAGMDARIEIISSALRSVFPQTAGIIAKNDSALRIKEGLQREEHIVFGTIPDAVHITENGIRLAVSLIAGQKTGYFLDQRVNRAFIAHIAQDLSVLDCFTNQGGFALNAAKGGARNAVGIDISASAIARSQENAKINGFTNCSFIKADVFEYLKEQAQKRLAGEIHGWDMVILDPPAFTKSKANISQAKRGYADINRTALKLITPGGFLVSSSCSHHISADMLYDIIEQESARANRKLKLIFSGMQSPDHPVYMPMPETRYLKFFVFEVW